MKKNDLINFAIVILYLIASVAQVITRSEGTYPYHINLFEYS